MRKFLLKTSFLVMICLSFFVFSYFFTINKNKELDSLKINAEDSKRYIEANLKANELNIELLRKLAESYLDNVPTKSKPEEYLRYDLLRKTDNLPNYFNMDEAIVQKLQADIGNITGEGDYESDTDLSHEIQMALSLNPGFKKVWDNSKYSAWLSYLSNKNFVSIYPWIESKEYSFSKAMYKKDFYINAQPSNNPNKKSQWSEPYIDENNLGSVISLSTPVFSKGEYRGVLLLDVTIQALSAMLLENIKPNVQTVLINNNYHLIATSNYRDEYKETLFNAEDIFPNTFDYNKLKVFKDSGKVEATGDYFIVKKDIDGLPWSLYTFREKSQLNRQIFFEVAPMLIITFALLAIYYELYSRKKSERELEKVVKKLRKTTNKLQEESKTDHLTGLLNRRGIVDEIIKEHSRSSRKNREFSVIICDIDYFKRVNDTYGHDCGDFVLKTTATLMTENVKEIDFVGRWGGEEFVIMLVETSFRDAMKVAERLRKIIANHQINYDVHEFNISMSFGVTEYNPDQSLDENIGHADMALYQGKNTGRNRVIGSKKDGQYRTI